ncbi:saccharopine dehydrogenase NADP-binding domain-containing protein [Sporosarcina sp. FSL K6-3457]|uniref:saccharopine dehydrogenase NADP-binding domain-containing protein n=1 Tax=Sporosarcina sp. FSL K6-3457 TaxID=2978204 RepID=UPI0030F9E6AD
MKRDKIVVIGGYGQVGSIICKHLDRAFPGKVYAAGRNAEKAQQLVKQSNGSIQAMVLDIDNTIVSAQLEQVQQVIVCVEQKNTDFVQHCLQHGIDYIDISASYSFLQQIEALHDQAKHYKTTAVISVGLAPGITNLLAKYIQSKLESVRELTIYIMLGLGDRHGKAAINWTLHEALQSFERYEDNQKVRVNSFVDKGQVYFDENYGVKTAYDFNFADQHVLRHTLSIPLVKTRLCFDSTLVTKGLHILKKTGLIHCVPIQLLTYLFSTIHVGKPTFMVKVIGKGNNNQVEETMVQGTEEAMITAIMACHISQSLYDGKVPFGVYHSEQLFSWEEIYPIVKSRIEWKGN